MCHVIVMKQIHAILAIGIVALLPAAHGDQPARNAKPFAISFSADVKPVYQPDVRYPSYAAARDIDGSCDVTFAINPAGRADAIRVGACSSDVFRGAAKSAVEAMVFPTRANTIGNVRVQIRWAINRPSPLRTASLG